MTPLSFPLERSKHQQPEKRRRPVEDQNVGVVILPAFPEKIP